MQWLEPPLGLPAEVTHVAPRGTGGGLIAALAGQPTPGRGDGLRILLLSPINASAVVTSPAMGDVCDEDADICTVLSFTGIESTVP